MGILGFDYLSYDKLYSQYGGFQTPAMKITVNNSVISLLLGKSGSGMITDEVTVTLKKDEASSAVFTIANCYDLKTRKFNSPIQTGAKICIQFGYGSALRAVFQGYVDSLSYEFSDNPKIRVQAFDAVRLMMSSGKKVHTWEDKGFYLETIKEIMDDYKDICPFPVTHILPTIMTHGQLSQNSNGYEYVKKVLCKYCDRDLVIRNGEAYLINPYLQFGKVTDLKFGSGLSSFSYTPGYKKVEVTVTGDSLSGAVGKCNVKTAESYKTSMNKPQKISVKAPLKTSADCKTYAERIAFENLRSAQIASGTCVGIPDIIPGSGLGIGGIDSLWEYRTFYVDSVTHRFNTSGYTTAFQIKGWL